MKLTMETALHGVAAALAERVAPAVDDPFVGEVVRLATLFVTICANGVDDAAAARIAENAAWRALFADAAAIAPEDMRADLAQAAAGVDPGYGLRELDAEAGRLRTLLVALHAAVETQNDPACVAMNRRIWTQLRAIEARRAPNRVRPAG